MTDIVIARYNEDLSWLTNIDKSKYNIIIYNKGNELDKNLFPNYIQLPNIGRESHTYLHHIIFNHTNLSDYTYFLQGNPFDHCNDVINILNNNNTNFWLTNGIYHCDKNGAPHHYQRYSLDIIYNNFHNMLTGFSEPIAFAPGAQFCVHKDDILKHPLHKYELLYNQLLNDQVDAWQLERMWELLLIK